MSAEYTQLYRGTDFRKNPQLNRIGRGEQRVLPAEVPEAMPLEHRGQSGLGIARCWRSNHTRKRRFRQLFFGLLPQGNPRPDLSVNESSTKKIQEV